MPLRAGQEREPRGKTGITGPNTASALLIDRVVQSDISQFSAAVSSSSIHARKSAVARDTAVLRANEIPFWNSTEYLISSSG
jgi:hypothetical protein